MNRKCKVCGETFHVKPSQITRVRGGKDFNGGSYCSRKCQNEGRKKRIAKKCLNCNGEFEVIPSKKTQKFCGNSCRYSYRKGKTKTQSTPAGTKTVTCKNCNKPFTVPKSAGSKYCSRQCYHESRVVLVDKTCEHCGDNFKVTPSEIERGGGVYCSIGCHNKDLENHLIVKCLYCEKEMKTWYCLEEKGEGKFCSKTCFGAYYSGERSPSYGKPPSHGNQGIKVDLGHYVRSSWEANYARILKYNKIPYEYEPKTFELITDDGKKATYTPDFYIGHWVEIKGYWRDDAKEKVRLFTEQYPNERLEIIDKPVYLKLEKEYKNKIPMWE